MPGPTKPPTKPSTKPPTERPTGRPTEPPPSQWQLPDPGRAQPGQDLIGLGADLEPGTILAAYRTGLFPMPVDGRLGWWSPDPRGIIDRLKVSRSLTKATSKFEIRIDTAFEEVITSCAKPNRPGGWITDHIKRAYIDLHHRGWAHSVEAWADGELQGGLYGIAIGGFFAGESMFHRRTDASKVALVALQNITDEDGLLDVQWCTDHLASLGAREIPRTEYVARLQNAIQLPLPPALGGDGQVVGPVGHARHAEL